MINVVIFGFQQNSYAALSTTLRKYSKFPHWGIGLWALDLDWIMDWILFTYQYSFKLRSRWAQNLLIQLYLNLDQSCYVCFWLIPT